MSKRSNTKERKSPPHESYGMGGNEVAVRRYLPLRDAIKQFCDQLLKDGTDVSIVEAYGVVCSRVHDTAKSGVYIFNDFVRESKVFEDRYDYATLKTLVSKWNAFLANAGRLQVLPSLEPTEEIYQLI